VKLATIRAAVTDDTVAVVLHNDSWVQLTEERDPVTGDYVMPEPLDELFGLTVIIAPDNDVPEGVLMGFGETI
jgi:hypothetical protein